MPATTLSPENRRLAQKLDPPPVEEVELPECFICERPSVVVTIFEGRYPLCADCDGRTR